MSLERDNLEFEAPKYNTTLWAMSLADLLSIVLSIFVLLFAVSNTSKVRTSKTLNGVHGKFATHSITQTQDTTVQPEFEQTRQSASGAQEALKLYYAKMRKVARDILALDETKMIEKGNVMVFRLPTSMLFKPGSTEIDDKKQFVEALADQLTTNASGFNIDVEFLTGYNLAADKDGQQSSLALNRAGAFARKLVDLGVKENSIYTGVDESDPDTITITFFPRDETRSTLVF